MTKADRITRRPPEELTLHLTAIMQELNHIVCSSIYR